MPSDDVMFDEPSYRLARIGALAVHLMDTYHGRALRAAVNRIVRNGPKNKWEQDCVRCANEMVFEDDPLIPTERPTK